MNLVEPQEVVWTRFGADGEFPLVITADLTYEHISNKIVAATFGRGIYVVENAKESLLKHYALITSHNPSFQVVEEESSAGYFPSPL